MTEVEHREGCWYPKALEESRRYDEQWPDHCPRCGGWGGHTWYDSDTGLQDYDPCPECVEQGKCPRCGGGIIAETYWDAGHFAVCDNCSWIEATTPGEPPLVDEPCDCLGYWDEFERFVPHGGPKPPPLDDVPY